MASTARRGLLRGAFRISRRPTRIRPSLPSITTEMTAGALNGSSEGSSLELGDIQSGALHERPSPYVGRYLLLRIDDRAAGRELVRRLYPFVDSGRRSVDPGQDAWIT